MYSQNCINLPGDSCPVRPISAKGKQSSPRSLQPRHVPLGSLGCCPHLLCPARRSRSFAALERNVAIKLPLLRLTVGNLACAVSCLREPVRSCLTSASVNVWARPFVGPSDEPKMVRGRLPASHALSLRGVLQPSRNSAMSSLFLFFIANKYHKC